ncbi:MAG: N-acetylglucosamine-6-phosphate deacetylase [Rhodospirillaceae bacterium]|jgi:N-acetylglucosamine-6-phosphate deacetylase|nr:N-acetylglucosamine-6-phosphate deacetylase [Rhodospirillaceae bacterium]MBT6404382.1 N-acetylglucosamine-6-phosphate deacetylase [Rhodospirillaceae bacterium]MBT7361590.1 N-acetylglucosamine-6-phosphate deacetylase [Rhodospirillaceae bacterium]
MSESQRAGHILTPEGWVDGRIEFDSHIVTIEEDEVPTDASYIIPGFVDLHVPGGGGADVMQGEEAVRTAAQLHAMHGTTSFLPATITAPEDELITALAGIGKAQTERQTGEARVLGAHMEGPYINEAKLGAQPPFARDPDPAFLEVVTGEGVVKLVTLAPEVTDGLEMIRQLTAAGVVVQIGHSDADYEMACAALEAGARGFTHLFNAMSPLHHRAPGVAGAALAHGEYAALIPDGVHVAPGAMKVALRAIPKLFVVTDATAAAGMPDGEYPLGAHTVTKRDGSVFLDDDTLAGSALTMDQALANLLDLGLSLDEASLRTSTYPADFIGRMDRGRIQAGAWADLVVLDPAHKLVEVIVEGEAVR